MKCETCAEREATVAYTHIVDDEKKTLFLCPVCTGKKNIEESAGPAAGNVPELVKEAKVELTDLAEAEDAEGAQCPSCGMTYEEFKKAGRLGCSGCYEAFAPQLGRLLKRIHGANRHRGKGQIAVRPSPPAEAPKAVADELDQLRDELTKAVSAEAFEQAAQLRDQIRDLEGGQGR